jgi:hypothetical protein
MIGITDIAKEGNLVYESNGQSINFNPPWYIASNMDDYREHVAIVFLCLPLLQLHCCLENGLMSDVQALHRKLLNIIITKLNISFY